MSHDRGAQGRPAYELDDELAGVTGAADVGEAEHAALSAHQASR